MICKNCGYEIKEEDEFCGNCGKKVDLIDGDSMNQQALNKDYRHRYEYHDNYQTDNSMAIVKVIAIIMIVVALLTRDPGIKYMLAILGFILIGVTQRYTKEGEKRNKKEQVLSTSAYVARIIGMTILIPLLLWAALWLFIWLGISMSQH